MNTPPPFNSGPPFIANQAAGFGTMQPTHGFGPDDIYYVLFRHKWRILACATAGLIAAAGFYFLFPAPYQSEAMVFIRYVLESNSPGMPGNDARSISPDQRGETIMNTEIEILGSLDILGGVADSVGPSKILGKTKGPVDRDGAATSIRKHLIIEQLPKSSVIRVAYSNSDPSVVQPVLTSIVDAYLKKHVEVHRGSAAVGDFLTQQTDQMRSRLSQTEDALLKARAKAGIVSIDDAKRAYSEQEANIQQQIFAAEAELADRSAMLEDYIKRNPALAPVQPVDSVDSNQAQIPAGELDEFGSVLVRLDFLKKGEQTLLSQFTEGSQRVKDVREQIAAAEAKRQELIAKDPRLGRLNAAAAAAPATAAAATVSQRIDSIDPVTEAARLAGIKSKIKVLNSELAQVRSESAGIALVEGDIIELERQKELEETNYKYYSTHLEASRIDDALGTGRAINIAVIQAPTLPHADLLKTYKNIAGILFAGLVIGLGWAFSIEFYFDRTIRRATEIERNLQIPLFLSIPDFGKNGHNGHVFHATLRDRLMGYFESKGLTHKPKLVAVTGIARGAGVTTTAAGLAQALSEPGDGNVLLVDMTQSQGSTQRFCKGKAICDLDQLLETRDSAQVGETLFVVGAEPSSEKLVRALPMRFSQLVPKLKASDFDYIIFDMPAVNQISITPRLAGFMDMVLLVIESEETDREIAKEAVEMLAASRANLGAVLTMARNYLPSKLHHDFLGSA